MQNKILSKILIVDDDLDILTIAKYCLGRLPGVTIQCVNSGEKAIEEAIEFQPDLILLDVMMPKMDGIATLKNLQVIHSLSHKPVVFFTAKAQHSEINEYLKLGVCAVIIKPFDPMTIASKVLEIWEAYTTRKLDG